jgi:DNA-binding CsgD family transcriptional regulator
VVDISKYPYFSYDELLEPIIEPISSQSPVRLNTFRRWYTPSEQILIMPKWMEEGCKAYFAKELYKIAYFGHDRKDVESKFLLLDHFHSMAFQPVYKFIREESNCAHGLMIFQKHEKFLDMFIFTSTPQNDMVNNFYLNKKELFTAYIQEFYQQMAHVLDNLSRHRLILPFTSQPSTEPQKPRLTRQMECYGLLYKGLTSKEIGRQLHISPRTVDFYIDLLRKKTGARNRTQLIQLIPRLID